MYYGVWPEQCLTRNVLILQPPTLEGFLQEGEQA